MKATLHGLIIGKFYPPHAGHHELIRKAAGEVGRLSVLVMASMAESLPLAERVHWISEEHSTEANVSVSGIPCDVPLDLFDDRVWEAQVAVISAALKRNGAGAVDVVFSGERYGRQLATRLGAVHRHVERTGGDLSATAVRADPVGRWTDLAAPTRGGLATRVILVGAESTGTTTISELIAGHYRARGGIWERTALVEEYGRAYTELKWAGQRQQAVAEGRRVPGVDELAWVREDFDLIAATQTGNEELTVRCGSPLVICDTDAFATSVWERRYLAEDARSHPVYAEPPALSRRDLYLVTDHLGVGWTDDGMREGDLVIRNAMTGWFIDALTSAGHSWILLTGSLEDRVSLGVRAIDPVLDHRLSFAEPLRGPGFEPTPAAVHR